MIIPKFHERQRAADLGWDGFEFADRLFKLLPELAVPFVTAMANSSNPEDRLDATDLLEHADDVDRDATAVLTQQLIDDPVPRVSEHAAVNAGYLIRRRET